MIDIRIPKFKIFEDFFDRMMLIEGGYVNHPNDPGGETMWGVTARVARAHGYNGSMRKLPKSTAKAIAKKSYWDAIYGDQLHPAIAFQMLDASYNHGIKQSVKFLQRAINVNDDGIIGPVTLAAVAQRDKNDVIFRFNAERLYFYTILRTWNVFGKGWSRRIVENLRAAALDNDL